MFAVIERKEKRFIGRCGLQPLENSGLIELGYTFVPRAWGKGYATEAAMEVLRTAFGDWGLEKVVAIAKGENRASIRVMEKIGMQHCGRERFYGKDVVLYATQRQEKTVDSLFQCSFRQSSKLSMPAL
jgi:ribosomal-protein-alanine N-acetyltransferase